MKRTEPNKTALKDASKNAQQAIDAIHAPKFAAVPTEEKKAWAMAAMIHCDICRLVVAFDECEREGVARLLWIGDIVSKLYEARRWYFGNGNKLLHDISINKSCNVDAVGKKMKEIKSNYPIDKIKSYSNYRNKLVYHYDVEALAYLAQFGKKDAHMFYELLKTFVQFSGEWAELTSSVIKNEFSNKAL